MAGLKQGKKEMLGQNMSLVLVRELKKLTAVEDDVTGSELAQDGTQSVMRRPFYTYGRRGLVVYLFLDIL